jgi:putative tricarboxylic transport membrane protein
MTKDRALAIAISLFVIVMYIESYNIAGKSDWQKFSSAFYPRVLLTIMTILAVILLIRSFVLGKHNEKIRRSVDFKVFLEKYWKVILLFISFGIYVFILTRVGFVISSALYLFISQLILMGMKSRKSLFLNISITVIATLSIFFIFNYGLNVWLP